MNFFTFLHFVCKQATFKIKSFVFITLFLAGQYCSHAQIPGMSKLSIQLLLNLNGGSNNTADGVVAVFAPVFSSSVGNEDSYKFTNLDENLAINCGGTLLSIEGRPSLAANDTLPLIMWEFRQNNYFLQIIGSDFSTASTATILDNYLNLESTINLADTTTLHFSINADSASFARNRFLIAFKTGATLPVTLSDVKAMRKDKGALISWIARTQSNTKEYEIEKSLNGQSFTKAAIIQPQGINQSTYSYSWFDNYVNNGNNFYRIKAIEKTGEIKYSAILRVNAESDKRSINIFPNPVKGNTIGLQLFNIAKEDYTVSLYNGEGQKVYAKAIKYDGVSANLSVNIDRQLNRGLYTLQFANNEIVISKTMIIQ